MIPAGGQKALRNPALHHAWSGAACSIAPLSFPLAHSAWEPVGPQACAAFLSQYIKQVRACSLAVGQEAQLASHPPGTMLPERLQESPAACARPC